MEVLIYARLSQQDETGRAGEATATQRQIVDCRAKAEREGWTVAAIYEDPDHSASNLRRPRPDFERMLADLGDGVQVDAVVCYKLDRLLRHPREAERIIDLADRRGFGIVSLNDPGIDLITPTGRAHFRMNITWAKLETETLSLRVRRKARDMAESGHPNGGGIRSFGLTPDKSAVIPEEAALVRDAAERIIAGESLHSIVVDWNERGVRTPGRKVAPEGRKWEVSSLRRMLVAPRVVGDRSYHGEIVASGAVPPLLERGTWDRLGAVLAAPRGGNGGSTVRKHYLTGLACCGRCGKKLVARPDAKGTTRYVCAVPRGCGRLVIAKAHLEPLIAEAIAIRLDSPALRAALEAHARRSGSAIDMDQLRADEAALEEVASLYLVERTIDKTQYLSVRGKLTRRIEDARGRVERATSGAMLQRAIGLDIRAEWEQRPALWKHELARTLIERVTIGPAPRRGTRFDPSRVDVEWRA